MFSTAYTEHVRLETNFYWNQSTLKYDSSWTHWQGSSNFLCIFVLNNYSMLLIFIFYRQKLLSTYLYIIHDWCHKICFLAYKLIRAIHWLHINQSPTWNPEAFIGHLTLLLPGVLASADQGELKSHCLEMHHTFLVT